MIIKIVPILVFVLIICYLVLPGIHRYRTHNQQMEMVLGNSLAKYDLEPREGVYYKVNSKTQVITIVNKAGGVQ